jgi:lipopolysaccharide export system permease protein
MGDVLRKKPTLSIQAGVFTTEEQIPNYRILVRKTFEKSNDLEGVTIYDLSKPDKNVVVTAEEGTVSFSPDYTKIFMDLRDGTIHQLDDSEPGKYRRLRFERHRVAIPASGFGFERSDASKARRDDRTMSAGMMMRVVDSIRTSRARKDSMLVQRLMSDLDVKFNPTVEVVSRRGTREWKRDPFRERRLIRYTEIKPGDSTLARIDTAAKVEAKDSVQAAFRASGNIKQFQSYVQGDIGAINFDTNEIDKYLVEVYKKYSIPVACMVFVLVGVPLGMMARRGGFGVGAGLSLGFFLFYWACLIGGEKLADRGFLSPFWGMWIGNVILFIIGMLLTLKAGREMTIIDWTRFSRFVPKLFRMPADAQPEDRQGGRP